MEPGVVAVEVSGRGRESHHWRDASYDVWEEVKVRREDPNFVTRVEEAAARVQTLETRRAGGER